MHGGTSSAAVSTIAVVNQQIECVVPNICLTPLRYSQCRFLKRVIAALLCGTEHHCLDRDRQALPRACEGEEGSRYGVQLPQNFHSTAQARSRLS